MTPFLLTAADDYGTLAAARCLGARGVPVIVADDHLMAPTLWSRHVRKRVTCPPLRPLDRFLAWLLAFGDRHPGLVLYPTSDDLAWLFSAHERELSKRFRMWLPPHPAMLRVLDKGRLHAACEVVGLRTPETWFPHEDDLERLAPRLRYPVMIKPRTQVLSPLRSKGRIVRRERDLARAYRAFQRRNGGRPMIQSFHTSALGIRSITGFCGPAGSPFVARASQKVLQWPRQIGLGICFEDAPLDPVLADRIRGLCKHVGYHGVFEVEMLERGKELLLIDFNPRFFGQVGFDVARGLPSPWLVYLATLGRSDELQTEADAASQWTPNGNVYVNRFALEWSIVLERLVGHEDGGDAWRWDRWRAEHHAFDAVATDDDIVPAVVDACSRLWSLARHPGSVFRAAFRGA